MLFISSASPLAPGGRTAGPPLSPLPLACAFLSGFCPKLVREAGAHMDNDAMACCPVIVERCPEYKGSTEGQAGQVGRTGWVAWVLKMEKDLVKCIKGKGQFIQGMGLAKVWSPR